MEVFGVFLVIVAVAALYVLYRLAVGIATSVLATLATFFRWFLSSQGLVFLGVVGFVFLMVIFRYEHDTTRILLRPGREISYQIRRDRWTRRICNIFPSGRDGQIAEMRIGSSCN